jgi:heme exporter protein A
LLEAVALECTRGDRPLFRDLSFRLAPGELLHVVGPNGSGKTTLLRTLCGLTRPSEGETRWRGTDIRRLGDEYRACLAYVGHANGLLGELTAYENLQSAACLSGGDPRAAESALQAMALAHCRDLPAKVLSQGQKRRLALARLLVAPKPLWILDEPFTALDVDSGALINEVFARHLAEGGLIVMTSHQDFTVQVKTIMQLRLEAAA